VTNPDSNDIALVQVEYIFDTFDGQIATAPDPDWLKNRHRQELDFLYRPEFLLVRKEQLRAVQEVLKGLGHTGKPVSEPAPGVLLVLVPGVRNMLPARDAITKQVGPGAADLDYVLSITPATWCPHGEPRLPANPAPQPSISHANGCDGAGVKVAVVDTGLLHGAAQQHAWMHGVDGEFEPTNDSKGNIGRYAAHGTFIASCVRAMAPKATIRVFRYFQKAGATFESDLVRELDRVVNWQPDIISLSGGSRTIAGMLAFDPFVNANLKWPNGPLRRTVLVAAAGNYGETKEFFPAALTDELGLHDAVVSVGALNHDSTGLAAWSDRGEWVKVYAEGGRLVQAFASGNYKYYETPPGKTQPPPDQQFAGIAEWSGTSFATPLVAGMIAARMSARHLGPRQAWRELHQIAVAQALKVNGLEIARLMPHQGCAPLPVASEAGG
jgi:subtilisin family serine protease